ncbi:hypothetical protein ACLOJK_019331 [Asimina triloba]
MLWPLGLQLEILLLLAGREMGGKCHGTLLQNKICISHGRVGRWPSVDDGAGGCDGVEGRRWQGRIRQVLRWVSTHLDYYTGRRMLVGRVSGAHWIWVLKVGRSLRHYPAWICHDELLLSWRVSDMADRRVAVCLGGSDRPLADVIPDDSKLGKMEHHTSLLWWCIYNRTHALY